MTATQPAKPMRADAKRNCEHLLAVAREVFGEQGTDAPLDEIVKRAKVGAGTLYRHFPTRETLLESVYRAEIVGLADRAHDLIATCAPDEALERWLREQVSWVLRSHGLAMSLKSAIDKESEVYTLCMTAMRDAAGALLKPLQDEGRIRPDITPANLLRLAHGVAIAAENFPEEERETMLSVVVNGLRA